ncbi:site-specific integrase [Faecalibacterium prausnitzii]
MAYITKRGNSYSVRYTYEDEHGKSCDKWESFPTKEEATNRKKQIEHELAAGTFLIPSSVTVAEFLMDWLPKQCSKHKWAPKTYESNLSTIQNLIIPYIGSMEMQKLKPYHMENLYTTLSKTPCGSYIEGKKQELTEKQKQRFLSGTTIHEVHRLLGTAFQYAVEWGILVKSPVPVDSPKKSTQERTIWTVEEMRAALDSMEDPILHLAVHLTLVGALREGEIVGLTPEDLDFDAADGIGTFRINKSMQRVRKEALNQVDDGCIIKVFPDKLERSTTSLILKSTKTASSCRTIFMTSALKEELKKWLNQLATDERKDPTRYHDSGMLFRLPNGLAVEPVLIRKKFLKWQDAHPEFPRIVFHGLRHSSAHLSADDLWRRCEGRSGHHRTRYGGYAGEHLCAHIQKSSRVELGKKFEEGFYAKQENPSPQAVPAADESTISMTALLELLKNADPEVKAQLRLALLTCKIYHAFQSNSSPCRGFL